MWKIAAVGAISTLLTNSYAEFIDVNLNENMTDYRTDMCDSAEEMLTGKSMLSSILSGKNLTFVTMARDPDWFAEDESGTQSGFHSELMELVAKNANFTYTIMVHNGSQGLQFTEYYLRSAAHFDLVLDWATQSTARSQLGLVVPYGFLDLSVTVSGLDEDETSTLYETAMKILLPFTPGLWGALVGIVIITSWIYLGVEHRYNAVEFPPHLTLYSKVYNATFIGFVQIFTYGSFRPKTQLGKLVISSYSFLCLLVIATYTANLATMLITEIDVEHCKTFEDCASHKDNRFCMNRGSSIADYIKLNYPALFTNGQAVLGEMGANFENIREKNCEFAISTHLEYEFNVINKRFNPNCGLARVTGDALFKSVGGWIGRLDYTDRCTSVLLDSIRFHLLELAINGGLDSIYDNLMTRKRSRSDCPIITNEPSSIAISASDLSGVLFIHGFFIVISVAGFAYKRNKKKVDKKGDDMHKEMQTQNDRNLQGQIEQINFVLDQLIARQSDVYPEGIDNSEEDSKSSVMMKMFCGTGGTSDLAK